MAQTTLRENRRSATHQNATTVNWARMRVLVQEPFYQHDHLGPGADLTLVTDQGYGNGYYDWAGRRLFSHGQRARPDVPRGAYRYQHNPACCDLEAPDSDPRSPRYEPMHLRHQPGDTWIIDTDRPHDPFDPGPSGWFHDRRTGRHRLDETPDPLPSERWVNPGDAWHPGMPEWPEPEPPQQEPNRANDRRNDKDRPNPPSPGSGTGRRPAPSRPDEPPRFSRLREAAFDRFIANSAQLRAAQFAPENLCFRERVVWALHWTAWVLGLSPCPGHCAPSMNGPPLRDRPRTGRAAAKEAPRPAAGSAVLRGSRASPPLRGLAGDPMTEPADRTDTFEDIEISERLLRFALISIQSRVRITCGNDKAIGSVIRLDTDHPALCISTPLEADWAGLRELLIAEAVRIWNATIKSCDI